MEYLPRCVGYDSKEAYIYKRDPHIFKRDLHIQHIFLDVLDMIQKKLTYAQTYVRDLYASKEPYCYESEETYTYASKETYIYASKETYIYASKETYRYE